MNPSGQVDMSVHIYDSDLINIWLKIKEILAVPTYPWHQLAPVSPMYIYVPPEGYNLWPIHFYFLFFTIQFHFIFHQGDT